MHALIGGAAAKAGAPLLSHEGSGPVQPTVIVQHESFTGADAVVQASTSQYSSTATPGGKEPELN